MSRPLAILALLLVASPASAHVRAEPDRLALDGLLHPLQGADHLLTMLAVGLFAATQVPPARWALPLSFLLAMAAGLGLGGSGHSTWLTEPLIIGSLLVLGSILALALSLSVPAGVALVGLFGLAHGAAHGLEGGAGADPRYLAGVLGTTTLLQAAGVMLGRRLVSSMTQDDGLMLRFLGGGLGVGGIALAFG